MELDPSSVEAEQELKQAQTLHLMVGDDAQQRRRNRGQHEIHLRVSCLFQEMGFSWAESSKALKTHTTMEDAIESLFNEGGGKAFLEGAGLKSRDNCFLSDGGTENTDQAAVQEEDDDDAGVKEDWITQRSSRHRAQRAGEPVNLSRCPSTRPRSGNAAKPYVLLLVPAEFAGTALGLKWFLLWFHVKETVPCVGRSLGPFRHLRDAAPALQQVREGPVGAEGPPVARPLHSSPVSCTSEPGRSTASRCCWNNSVPTSATPTKKTATEPSSSLT